MTSLYSINRMDHEEKKPGLLLQTTPYLEKHKILKVLTQSGLVTLIAKYSTSSKNALFPFTIPFLYGEWIYRYNLKKEIYPLIDGSLIDPLNDLKTSFTRLTAASQIAKDLLQTQMPGKCATSALALAVAFLQKISQSQTPEMLLCSFRLKLLQIEGLLSPDEPFSDTIKGLAFSKSFFEIFQIPKDEKTIASVNSLFEDRLKK